MKLYELSAQYGALTEYLSSDEPEDAEKLKSQLANITEQLNVKAENIGKLILGYEAECMAIKSEVERLTRRKNTIENRVTWLKDYVKTEMEIAKLDKISGEIITLSLRKNPISINVTDVTLVPKIFQHCVPESWVVEKKLIADHVKSTGEVPPGIEVIQGKMSLIIK